MKRLLLSIAAIAITSMVFGQAVVTGVYPANIQGNYTFGVQAGAGVWGDIGRDAR